MDQSDQQTEQEPSIVLPAEVQAELDALAEAVREPVITPQPPTKPALPDGPVIDVREGQNSPQPATQAQDDVLSSRADKTGGTSVEADRAAAPVDDPDSDAEVAEVSLSQTPVEADGWHDEWVDVPYAEPPAWLDRWPASWPSPPAMLALLSLGLALVILVIVVVG